MRFHGTTFFCGKGEGPIVHINYNKKDHKLGYKWPFTVVINTFEESYQNPSLIIHLDSEQDLIQFKNSVISAYENYLLNRDSHVS